MDAFVIREYILSRSFDASARVGIRADRDTEHAGSYHFDFGIRGMVRLPAQADGEFAVARVNV